MSRAYVLDSFAILALLGHETGSDIVSQTLRQAQADEVSAFMTWINVGEVAYIVERRWGKGRVYQVLGTLEATKIKIFPVNRTLTLAAAHIKAQYPLAYADAFAAALAMQENAQLLTGDPEFEILEEHLEIQWLNQ